MIIIKNNDMTHHMSWNQCSICSLRDLPHSYHLYLSVCSLPRLWCTLGFGCVCRHHRCYHILQSRSIHPTLRHLQINDFIRHQFNLWFVFHTWPKRWQRRNSNLCGKSPSLLTTRFQWSVIIHTADDKQVTGVKQWRSTQSHDKLRDVKKTALVDTDTLSVGAVR